MLRERREAKALRALVFGLAVVPDQMETTPPFPVISSQRQLSVIMFTDAVGFSARMHEQEVATLNRVERDTEIMRRMIEAQSGTVMKSTGDGLLIQFTSAVQAVACAIEIQRLFSAPAEAPSSRMVLRYRVGIHLGDVFVGNGDVMGDGVNIAARLVNLAPAGGILISQTVYDVVKNKLPLQVLRVGPQQLKNIKEPVTLYRVLLEDKRLGPAPSPAAPATPVPTPAAPTKPRSRKFVFLLLAALVLAVAGRYLLQEYLAHEDDLARSQSAQAAFDALSKQSSPDQASVTGTGGPSSPRYDFAGLTTNRPAKNDISPERAAVRLAAEQNVDLLFRWLAENLARYTPGRPLPVTGLAGSSFAGTTVFLDQERQLNFKEGGASRRQIWEELKPEAQAAIIVSALRDSTWPVPPEVREGAHAFAYLNGLPEMVAALSR